MREGGVETRNMIRGPSPAHCGLSAFFFLPRLYISSGFLPQSTATSSNIQRFRVPVSPDSCHRPWGVSARVGGFGCGGGRGRASRPVDQRRGRCRGSATTAARFSMQGKGRGNGVQKQKRQTHRNNKMQRRDGQYVPGRGRGLDCGRAGELCGTGRRGESGSGSSEGGVRRWRRDDGRLGKEFVSFIDGRSGAGCGASVCHGLRHEAGCGRWFGWRIAGAGGRWGVTH